LVVDLQGLFRTGFLSWASGAPVRIGFASAREGASMFYTHRVRIENPDTHAVDRNLRVGELLGFEDGPPRFRVTITESARDEARGLLRDAGYAGGERLAVIAPGARWETKVWPAERFAAVIDELQRQERTRCVLIGSPDEVSLCERVAGRCRSAPFNLAGKTSLPQLAALVELADVVLCHDSAVMHLAVAFERPLVCLVGPTNAHRTGPYRRTEDVLQLKLDCSPCYLRRLSQCRHEHRCMSELDTPIVVAAVKRRLPESAARPV
jgi:ADP-heptose:LPS heptosyltransferase